jgi:hypothetical protein
MEPGHSIRGMNGQEKLAPKKRASSRGVRKWGKIAFDDWNVGLNVGMGQTFRVKVL